MNPTQDRMTVSGPHRRIALTEWESPTPWEDEPSEVESTLTLHNCFWHNWGSLMCQGSDIAPK